MPQRKIGIRVLTREMKSRRHTTLTEQLKALMELRKIWKEEGIFLNEKISQVRDQKRKYENKTLIAHRQ